MDKFSGKDHPNSIGNEAKVYYFISILRFFYKIFCCAINSRVSLILFGAKSLSADNIKEPYDLRFELVIRGI